MKDFILGVTFFFAAPYIRIWDRLRYGKQTHSGHTAGLCEGFCGLLAGLSAIIQIGLLILGIFIYLIL